MTIYIIVQILFYLSDHSYTVITKYPKLELDTLNICKVTPSYNICLQIYPFLWHTNSKA